MLTKTRTKQKHVILFQRKAFAFTGLVAISHIKYSKQKRLHWTKKTQLLGNTEILSMPADSRGKVVCFKFISEVAIPNIFDLISFCSF